MINRVVHIILVLSISLSGFSQQDQDSLAKVFIAQKNIKELQNEQKELNFQKFFFEALQQKAVGNFDKAIIALENCQNIKNDNKAVQFEFGKNYFELGSYMEAEAYTRKALDKDPENLYIMILLKDIYNKQNNYKDALELQIKIAQHRSDAQLDLVVLYIKNNQIDNAKQLLIDLEETGRLSDNLKPFKDSLLKGKVSTPIATSKDKPIEEQTLEELRNNYRTNKSFTVLRQILIKLNAKKKYLALESDSKEALELFPAQPFGYLMNGTSLNQMKKYNAALSSLQSGLDYVIDDVLLEADFYEQMSLSYKGMGQNVNASKFYNKAVALRQKKS